MHGMIESMTQQKIKGLIKPVVTIDCIFSLFLIIVVGGFVTCNRFSNEDEVSKSQM